ncbi:hypothetical protein PIB30_086834, partial [Stylosanthes scabra]|nr:hypothetical protein [Stylosanthes scabra]
RGTAVAAFVSDLDEPPMPPLFLPSSTLLPKLHPRSPPPIINTSEISYVLFPNTINKKDRASKASSSAAANDSKLKASNFLGTWEYKSRKEGDLVAKCYFAKHKLVWEVLDGCLF